MTADDILRHLRLRAAEILGALMLLTRLPLPDGLIARLPPRHGAQGVWAWPLVGLILGLIGAGVAGLAAPLGAGIAAALVLAALALLTGALHEDGLADTADGLLGGQSPERRLEIMKDSRIGSYGALALILITLIRWQALAVLIGAGHWGGIVAAAALSRAPMAVLMAALPAARASGLSSATGRPTAAAASITAALAIGIAATACPGHALTMLMAVALPVLGLAWAAKSRIGGQTGDILGASQQLACASALTACASGLL